MTMSPRINKDLKFATYTSIGGKGKKGKVHPCTGTEALYRPYRSIGEVEVHLYCTGTEALYRPYGL